MSRFSSEEPAPADGSSSATGWRGTFPTPWIAATLLIVGLIVAASVGAALRWQRPIRVGDRVIPVQLTGGPIHESDVFIVERVTTRRLAYLGDQPVCFVVNARSGKRSFWPTEFLSRFEGKPLPDLSPLPRPRVTFSPVPAPPSDAPQNTHRPPPPATMPRDVDPFADP